MPARCRSPRFLTYVRAVARRTELHLEEPIVSIPPRYEERPLLRDRTR